MRQERKIVMTLNESEKRALSVICNDCDEMDGWGFTRPAYVVPALVKAFDGNAHRAGGYFRDLAEKGCIDHFDDEVWVRPDVFAAYC